MDVVPFTTNHLQFVSPKNRDAFSLFFPYIFECTEVKCVSPKTDHSKVSNFVALSTSSV